MKYEDMGFDQRIFQEFSVFSFKNLYCSLIRSILDYCCIVWCPCYSIYIYKFKMGSLKDKYNYNDILIKLNLNSLEYRRVEFGLRFIYGLLSGAIQSP